MDRVLLLYHLLVLGGLLLALLSVLVNVACFRGLRPVELPPAPELPSVSILVPARNEARNIEACVSSLLAQDYPNFELIVLDDHSEDETADLIRKLGLGDQGPRRLVSGVDLPAGWTGKGWACYQLSLAAQGDYLFFTDADTIHAPGTVLAAVAMAEENRADLLSAWPRLLTETLGEKLVIPMILLLGMVSYPHWLLLFLQNHPHLAKRLPYSIRRGLGAANGQFMFFSRSGYDCIGGHAALHDHLVEDVALGRAVAARMDEGLRLFNVEALEFSTCRMYRSMPEVWEGFTKNLRAAFEDSLGAFLALGASQVCCFLLPFFFLLMPGRWLWLVLAQVAIIYLIRFILAARFRTSRLSCLLHPIGEILALAIGVNSWLKLSTKGVSWKGRTYRASGPSDQL